MTPGATGSHKHLLADVTRVGTFASMTSRVNREGIGPTKPHPADSTRKRPQIGVRPHVQGQQPLLRKLSPTHAA